MVHAFDALNTPSILVRRSYSSFTEGSNLSDGFTEG